MYAKIIKRTLCNANKSKKFVRKVEKRKLPYPITIRRVSFDSVHDACSRHSQLSLR